MTKEIYKSIENYTNYAVSNRGNNKNTNTRRILKPTVDKTGYLKVSLCSDGKKQTIKIHRLVASAFLETVKGKSFVDHIDGDKTNNKVKNLRYCTPSQNNMNRTKQSKNSTSQYKGVCFDKNSNKWKAYIHVNKKTVHIGYFKSEIHAGKAYNAQAKELFGEFAKLNFKDEED